MGNRAVITTPERKVGLYLHWNGGRDTVEPLLKYCELQGYRPPSQDCYGWARMCQVMGNFFGGSLSVGIGAYTTDECMDPGDNGIYVIDGWKIVERLQTRYGDGWERAGMRPVPQEEEQNEHGFDEMLHQFDAAMPESLRLGAYLDAEEIPVSEVRLGDMVWMDGPGGERKPFEVMGFGQPHFNRIAVYARTPEGGCEATYPDLPYVAIYDHDGDYSRNANNYVRGPMARIEPRK